MSNKVVIAQNGRSPITGTASIVNGQPVVNVPHVRSGNARSTLNLGTRSTGRDIEMASQPAAKSMFRTAPSPSSGTKIGNPIFNR